MHVNNVRCIINKIDEIDLFLLSYLLMFVVVRYGWRVSFAGANESCNVVQIHGNERDIVAPQQGNGRSQTKMYVCMYVVVDVSKRPQCNTCL